MFSAELKKGSVELLILAMLEDQPRHGYEIGKLIELRSGGRIRFRISSLYPILCRMEEKGWIRGRWVEKEGERRRCFYNLTAKGTRALADEQETWREYASAVEQAIGWNHA
ncbi:PadR family transcriptional regulator [Gemmatimonadota bacterium]